MGKPDRKRRTTVLLAFGLAAAALSLASAPPATGASDVAVGVAAGRADIASFAIGDGALSVMTRLGQADGSTVEHHPSEVEFDVLEPSPLPDDPVLAPLGAPGAPVWATASSATRSAPELGWDTTAIATTPTTDGVTWALIAVEGPGAVLVYDEDESDRRTVRFGTTAGTERATTLPAGRSERFVWAFDQAGDYRVTMQASARGATGPLTSETVHRFRVGGRDAPSGPTVQPPTSLPTDVDPNPAVSPVPVVPTTVEELGGSPESGSPEVTDRDAPVDAQAEEPPGTTQAVGRVVIGDGHIDIGPQFIGGAFVVQIRDDSGPAEVWRNTEDVVLWSNPASELTIPPDPAFAFLGPAGAPSWVLPQTQRPGLVWPGWNTQAPSVKAQIPGGVDWTVRGVNGPGTFHLFLNGNFGDPNVVFDSTRPFPQTLPIPRNTHAHANWAFSQEGVYRLDVEFSATTAGGLAVSDRRTISLAVGNVDPNTAFPPPGGVGAPRPPGGSGPSTEADTTSGGSAGSTSGDSSSSGSESAGNGSGPNGSGTARGSGTSDANGLPSAGANATTTLLAAGVGLVGAGTLVLVAPGRRRLGSRRG